MSGLAFTSSHASLIPCIIDGDSALRRFGTVHGEHEHRPVALHEQVLVGRCLGHRFSAHGFVSRRTHMAKYWAAPP